MSRPEPCPKEIPIEEDADPFSPERLRLAPDFEAVEIEAIDDSQVVEGEETGNGDEEPSPFSPEALWMGEEDADADVEEVLLSIPVRRPRSKQEFVRVHPEFVLETLMLEDKEEDGGGFYLVHKRLRRVLEDHARLMRVFLATTTKGVVFFWPIPMAGPDGRRNSWHMSAEAAARKAMTRWTQLISDKARSGYRLLCAKEGEALSRAEPRWPDLPQEELCRLAFEERHITSLDHPVVQRLLGVTA
jgi:hypothetical protein